MHLTPAISTRVAPGSRSWWLAAVLLCCLGVSSVAQTPEQLEFWGVWQQLVSSSLEVEQRSYVEANTELAISVLHSLADQWEQQREADDWLRAADLAPHIYHLAAEVSYLVGDERATQVVAEIAMSPEAFRDKFELLWRRRAMAELRLLITNYSVAAYGCAGTMITGYRNNLARGNVDQANYSYELLGPMVLLIEEVLKDSRPREAAVPVPEGWKVPRLEPTFVPGIDQLGLADSILRDAANAERAEDLLRAINGYLNAARLYAKIEETKAELGCRLKAANIAIRVSDWGLAARLLPDVERLAAQLGDEQTRLYAVGHLKRLDALRASGEVEDVRTAWEREDGFGEWKRARLKPEELSLELEAVPPSLGANPLDWRWVAIGGDGTARLPLPGEPRVARLGGDLWVDSKLDGKFRLAITGDGETVSPILVRDGDGETRSYLVRFFAGKSIEFMGVEFSLGGRDLVFYRAAGTVKGKVLRTPVWLIDASGNGRFDDFERDGFAFGKKPGIITRLSRIVGLGGRVFELDADATGANLRFREFTGPTGVVRPTSKKGRLEACLLRPVGSSGVLLEAVAERGKKGKEGGATVPAGQYLMDEAIVTRGNSRVRVTTGDLPALDVLEDGEVALVLGRGVALEGSGFRETEEGPGESEKPGEDDDASGDEGSGVFAVIAGVGLVVKGEAGELYVDLFPELLLPAVEIEEGGEVTHRGQMERRDDATDTQSVRFPRDYRFELLHPEKPTRMRLSCEHPVLGAIESEWRAVK